MTSRRTGRTVRRSSAALPSPTITAGLWPPWATWRPMRTRLKTGEGKGSRPPPFCGSEPLWCNTYGSRRNPARTGVCAARHGLGPSANAPYQGVPGPPTAGSWSAAPTSSNGGWRLEAIARPSSRTIRACLQRGVPAWPNLKRWRRSWPRAFLFRAPDRPDYWLARLDQRACRAEPV